MKLEWEHRYTYDWRLFDRDRRRAYTSVARLIETEAGYLYEIVTNPDRGYHTPNATKLEGVDTLEDAQQAVAFLYAVEATEED